MLKQPDMSLVPLLYSIMIGNGFFVFLSGRSKPTFSLFGCNVPTKEVIDALECGRPLARLQSVFQSLLSELKVLLALVCYRLHVIFDTAVSVPLFYFGEIAVVDFPSLPTVGNHAVSVIAGQVIRGHQIAGIDINHPDGGSNLSRFQGGLVESSHGLLRGSWFGIVVELWLDGWSEEGIEDAAQFALLVSRRIQGNLRHFPGLTDSASPGGGRILDLAGPFLPEGRRICDYRHVGWCFREEYLL